MTFLLKQSAAGENGHGQVESDFIARVKIVLALLEVKP